MAAGVLQRAYVLNLPTTQAVSWAGAPMITVANFPDTQKVSVQGTVPVSGTFWQATQPISAASLPLPSGAARASDVAAVVTALGSPLQQGGSVAVSNFPASQTISGTVAATQSGNWVVGQAGTWTVQAVQSGNWSASVSGTVSVSNFPATQAVTGTFWQATQPVSVAQLPTSLGAKTSAASLSVVFATDAGGITTTSRGTGTMITGQIAMSAGNTAYLVAAARATRRSITFVPTSQFTYFYGNAGVTTTTGAAAPNGVAITLETTAAVYVVSGSTGTMTFVEHY